MTQLQEALMLKGQGVVSLVGAGGKTTLMFRLAHEIVKRGEPVLTTTTTKIAVPGEEESSCVIFSDSAESLVSKAEVFLKRHILHITAAADELQEEDKLIGLPPETVDTISKSRLFRWIIVEADGAARKPLKSPADHEPVIPESSTHVVGICGLSGIGKPLNEKWVHRSQQFAQITGIAAGKTITPAAVGDNLIHANGIFKNSPSHSARIAFLNQADVPGACEAGNKIADLLKETENTGMSRIIIGQTKLSPPVLVWYELTH
jgi:probable selenium-dependent hydroxylase accessory protein YqeC